jgi:Tfp pilus assembly protein PilO
MFFVTPSPIIRQAARSLLPLTVLTCIAIGILFGTWLMLQMPTKGRLIKAQTDYEAARQLQILQHAQRKTEEELHAVWQELPARKDFPNFILAVSELARQERILIPGMNYALVNVEKGLAIKGSIAFQVAGEYAGIRRFIHRLEMAGHFIFIESLDAKRSSDFTQSATTPVTFTISVATFLRPDPSASGET